ncbi:MAG: MoxR family ATPase [Spirochaetes bacterium]|nr:MoxR family ATPase [Spirochaetota bacterium]
MAKIDLLKKEIRRNFIGKEKIAEYILLALFSGLHVLIEDIPGVGKTTLAKTLAKCTGMDFSRIQFTPDLLPGDITGMTIWSVEKKDFVFKSGPVMHQFILADEINRASARTQSSLLEAMQEDTVTIDGKTYRLPQPFFVVATQNPLNFAGTFQLPEAQVDRFGISFSIGYPEIDDELDIIEKHKKDDPLENIKAVMKPEEILKIRNIIKNIYIDEKIKRYIIQIVTSTRNNENIKLGLSPRASLHITNASQYIAFTSNRDFVIPEDIMEISQIVISHKLILSPKAKLENLNANQIINSIISAIPKPAGIK